MEKTKIAVLVSGGGTNLQTLINAQVSGVLKSGEIVAVVSDTKGCYALERAKNAGIASYEFDKKAFASKAEYEKAVVGVLESVGADLVVLAGFFTVLSDEFVKHFDRRIVNVHPALIPAFSGIGFYGLAPHKAALERGVKITGATVHFVNEVCDGGEIIMQKAVEVVDGDTPETLQKRVMEQGEQVILPLAVEKVSAEIAESKAAK